LAVAYIGTDRVDAHALPDSRLTSVGHLVGHGRD
jgi:hypothetical protein